MSQVSINWVSHSRSSAPVDNIPGISKWNMTSGKTVWALPFGSKIMMYVILCTYTNAQNVFFHAESNVSMYSSNKWWSCYMYCSSFILQPPPIDSFTQSELSVYSVEYTAEGITNVGFSTYPNKQFIIEDLSDATEYSVRVAVNNSAGLGDYSSPPVIITTNAIGQYKSINQSSYNLGESACRLLITQNL